jgi:predicted AAA+ superfamily ATPase
LLSSELSTHFRWRIYEYRGFPLTFSEILRFKQIKEKEFYSSEELWIIKNTLNNILIYGNFPEIVLNKDNNIVKINNLKTYFDILLYKDLLEKYKIDNEPALKYFLKNITKSYTKTLNINKIYNELKSQQITIWKNTLYQYWEYIKSVFFAYELENFYNPKSLKKWYLYNLWFNKLLSDKENLGQSFENFVLLELLKKYDKVYFKKNWKEIDFYIEEKNLNIQVCYELNIENLDREIKPLLKQDGEKILVYFEKDDNLKIDKNVKLVSFEKIEKSV